MASDRRAVRREFGIEMMESRLVPSGTGSHAVAAAATPAHHPRPQDRFVATLSPTNVVLPVDMQGDQIQGSGGAALYPLPPSTDPAKGTAKFYITDEGKEVDVSITLSDISNIASISINDLADPADFSLRGTATAPEGQTPALPNGFSSTTINSTQQPASPNTQIMSANIGQAVVVLLKPAAGSGTIRHNSIQGAISASDLTGPMAGHPLASLVKAFRQTVSQPNGGPVPALYVNVETSSGIGPATGAQQDGNFPNGELRGPVGPKPPHAKKSPRD